MKYQDNQTLWMLSMEEALLVVQTFLERKTVTLRDKGVTSRTLSTMEVETQVPSRESRPTFVEMMSRP